MKSMNKRINFFAMILSLFLLVTACGTQISKSESDNSRYDAIYSNLVDSESQEILAVALEDAGVQKDFIDVLLESIKKYNYATGSILPVQSGFEVFTEKSASVYDATKLERMWKKKYGNLEGRKNCRITAIEAMSSSISYDATFQTTEQLMLVEIADISAFQSDSILEEFKVLFNGIETDENISPESQVKLINEYWSQAGVDFHDNDKISLISIWFNNTDIYGDDDRYVLHCGHAAVLIHTDSDGVLLLEKLDYNFPYQLIKFPSEKQALRYIVEFNCMETSDSIVVPIVLVGKQLLRIENELPVY